MSGALVYTQVDTDQENGTQSELFGVNDSGDWVGVVIDRTGIQNDFLGNGTNFEVEINVPANLDSQLTAINNSGKIIGFYYNFGTNIVSFATNTSDTAIAIPGVPLNAVADGIDANGDIVGVLLPEDELEVSKQFEVQGGVYSVVDNPPNVVFNSISEDGDIGLVVISSDQTNFENVLATQTGAGGGPLENLAPSFEAHNVNNLGQVVGFDTSFDGQDGFFRDTDGTVYAVYVQGSAQTFAEGINDNGEIVGFFKEEDGTVHGFTTTVADVIAADDVLAAACYCAGTLIATDNGEVPVEDLKIGDRLLTGCGALRPIKWIGRRSYGGRFIAGSKDILPVCIKAGALADNVPRRDLWISPHHAMFIDGLLIEARHLVNGTSIVQAERADTVSYFHIELETHDVIVAEGTLSETYMDEDSRTMFQNVDEYETLFSGVPALAAQYCAPRVDDGYELEAVRQRITRRGSSKKLDAA